MAIECESTRRLRVCLGVENDVESMVVVVADDVAVAAVTDDAPEIVDAALAADSTDE